MGEAGGEIAVALLNYDTREAEKPLRAELDRSCEWTMGGGETETDTKELCKDVPTVPERESQEKGDLHATELEPSVKNTANEGFSNTLLGSCAEIKEMEIVNGTRSEHYIENGSREAINDTKLGPHLQSLAEEGSNAVELECSGGKQGKEVLIDGNELELSAKAHLKEGLDHIELENRVKEASTEDVFSEVSDPNLSPMDNTSSTINSHPVHNIQGGCREISSLCYGSSSAEESLSEGGHNGNDQSREVSTSCVVLEIPKHVSTTGIRKITFKFSKRKEDCDNISSVSSGPPVSDEFECGFHEIYAQNTSLVNDVNRDMYSNTQGNLVDDYIPNTEVKMSNSVVPDGYPTNVKKLLSTGILEGARVKYVSIKGERQLSGVIKDGGYLCGCSLCNFSKVLSAYEFELHAGGKTRHPNNHIYLENGKPIYSIIQELKTAPLSMLDEVIKDVAGSFINQEYFQLWKANLYQHNEVARVNMNIHGQPFTMYDFGTSCPTQVIEDKLTPTSEFCSSKFTSRPYHYSHMEMAERQKRVVKKPRLFYSSSFVEQKKSTDGGTKKRDNDLHRLLFMPNGLPDGTDLAYYSKGKKILGGYKQGNGIVCSCCATEISPSQFEAHAGWAAKRQPYRHIYTSSGLTLHDIALMLANGRTLASSNNDDMCAVCGDGGNLMICDACPRAFHAACLELQCCPASDWHCPYCSDRSVAARKVTEHSRPFIVRLSRVVKAPESVGGGCVICREQDFSVANFDDRTVLLCDQCEKEYHVGCLRISGLCDLKELPKDKWFCCGDCNKIYVALKNFVSSGAEVIPTSLLDRISEKYKEKGLVDVASNDVQWRILSGKSRYPEHLPLLSRAAAIFRECFDPIVAQSGRDLIPIMVYGRNISGQEFGGMYCVVLIVKSIVVSAGLLRIFGREVAELPLVATSRENQGKGYFQALFSCIERLLCSMDVKKLVLPAAEEAESIWTEKLGFRRMNNERMLKYTSEFQLTVFKGTSMLEKEVQLVGY